MKARSPRFILFAVPHRPAPRYAGLPAESAGDARSARNFSFTPSDAGEKLFTSKGCVECHVGARALDGLLKNQMLTKIAVGMWNHQPSMKNPPPTFTGEEMSQLISFVWAKQYFRGVNGSSARGKNVFAAKKGATCHDPGDAPLHCAGNVGPDRLPEFALGHLAQ